MASLFDNCSGKKHDHNGCNKGKCIKHELQKSRVGEKYYILMNGYPEFMPVQYIAYNESTDCATFQIMESISPVSVFPGFMGQSSTMICDANQLIAIVPIDN